MDTGTLGNCLTMCSKASFSWSFPHAVMVLQKEQQRVLFFSVQQEFDYAVSFKKSLNRCFDILHIHYT